MKPLNRNTAGTNREGSPSKGASSPVAASASGTPARDRPILFSAPMVQALLCEAHQPGSGKTQTRRLLTRLSKVGAVTEFGPSDTAGYDWHFRDKGMRWHDMRDAELRARLPWQVGDRLWVKEGWCLDAEIEGKIHYYADGEHVVLDDGDGFTATNKDGSERSPWKSSLFMSRGRSRLTLLVTDVRVERLQDISHEDAAAEGLIAERTPFGGVLTNLSTGEARPLTRIRWQASPDHPLRGMERRAFQDLWESINGPESWQANPWVVAVTFSVHARNIDQLAPIAEVAA